MMYCSKTATMASTVCLFKVRVARGAGFIAEKCRKYFWLMPFFSKAQEIKSVFKDMILYKG